MCLPNTMNIPYVQYVCLRCVQFYTVRAVYNIHVHVRTYVLYVSHLCIVIVSVTEVCCACNTKPVHCPMTTSGDLVFSIPHILLMECQVLSCRVLQFFTTLLISILVSTCV